MQHLQRSIHSFLNVTVILSYCIASVHLHMPAMSDNPARIGWFPDHTAILQLHVHPLIPVNTARANPGAAVYGIGDAPLILSPVDNNGGNTQQPGIQWRTAVVFAGIRRYSRSSRRPHRDNLPRSVAGPRSAYSRYPFRPLPVSARGPWKS